MRAGALASALSLKLKQGQLIVLDEFEMSEIKTKALAGILKTLGASNSLIVDADGNEKLRIGTRNMTRHSFLPPEGVNSTTCCVTRT